MQQYTTHEINSQKTKSLHFFSQLQQKFIRPHTITNVKRILGNEKGLFHKILPLIFATLYY